LIEPNILEYVAYADFNNIAGAIRIFIIRGAPTIGEFVLALA
jgi:methylthioribose-1-phosphate isomerase